jgi:uncharacterized cupin superfamily protein
MAQNDNLPILNIDQIEYRPFGRGEKFACKLGDAGRRLGAQKLGYNVTVVPPGKRAFPRHNHTVNEEMFLILEGEGEVVIGEKRRPVRKGDFIACPPGGVDSAHQIVNTSAAELKYLAVSTRLAPEIVEYPDSGKAGIMGEFPKGDGQSEVRRFIVKRQADENDYWDGEA